MNNYSINLSSSTLATHDHWTLLYFLSSKIRNTSVYYTSIASAEFFHSRFWPQFHMTRFAISNELLLLLLFILLYTKFRVCICKSQTTNSFTITSKINWRGIIVIEATSQYRNSSRWISIGFWENIDIYIRWNYRRNKIVAHFSLSRDRP
jgi:hypothetical protein